MNRFEIGAGLSCDLDLLIASRLLVQASSGQGKTRTIRRLLEQTHGKVQHLVIDPEGEYHTLREKFDYVLAAPKGGDVVAHPKHAGLLAHKLLELGVSAICDIYELNPKDRIAFVRRFFEALVNAPRELWHPALVVLDEAHVFCPEKGEAESAEAVIALASRGRKRAFCVVLATQRLAKLKKDAAAELNNKLIGGCNLDIDIDRAGEELGLPKSHRAGNLRMLSPGDFWAMGRAFRSDDEGGPLRGPMMVHVGPVVSKHAEPGEMPAPSPPPTAKVRAILDKLSSLPAEAEEQEKSLATLQKENAELRRHVTRLERNQVVEIREAVREVIKPVVSEESMQLLRQATTDMETLDLTLREHLQAISSAMRVLGDVAEALINAKMAVLTDADKVDAGRVARRISPSTPVPNSGKPSPAGASDIKDGQQKILDVVYELERRGLTPDVAMIARWLKLHPNGGRYRGNIRALMKDGYLTQDLRLDSPVQDRIGDRRHGGGYEPGLKGLPINDAQQAIVSKLTEHESTTIKDLATALHLNPNGGRFRGNVRWLRVMGVVGADHPLKLTEAAYK